MGVDAPVPFPSVKETRFPSYWTLGGPQNRSGPVWKILSAPGFDPQTVQPVASPCTDYAMQI